MPMVRLDNDPGVYRFELPDGRELSVNVFALGHVLGGDGELTTARIVSAMRSVAGPADVVLSLSEGELFARAMSAMALAQQQGNALGPPPT